LYCKVKNTNFAFRVRR